MKKISLISILLTSTLLLSTACTNSQPTPPAVGFSVPISPLTATERALRAELAADPLQIYADDTVVQVLLEERVGFATNSDQLRPEFTPILKKVAGVALDFPETLIELLGHADARGEESFNYDLSRRRAARIKAFLLEHGIDEKRVFVIAYGESAPIADNRSAAGMAANRRVEIRFLPLYR
jgi:outer membrane protein OmpA-like peptidoglycan-associated protein